MRLVLLIFLSVLLVSINSFSQTLEMKEGLFVLYQVDGKIASDYYRGSQVLFFLDSDTSPNSIQEWAKRLEGMDFFSNESIYSEKIYFGLFTSGNAISDALSGSQDSLRYHMALIDNDLSTDLSYLQDKMNNSLSIKRIEIDFKNNPIFGMGELCKSRLKTNVIQIKLIPLSVLVLDYHVSESSNYQEFYKYLWDDINKVYSPSCNPNFGLVKVLVGVK